MTDIIIQDKNEITLDEPRITRDLLSEFVSFIDGKPRTVATYRRSLVRFWDFLSLNRIDKPTRADILRYRDTLDADGLKANTINLYLVAVRLFFQWTGAEGLYPNIAEHIKGKNVNRGHKKDYLTTEQVTRTLSEIDRETLQGARDYAIVLLMVGAGLRTIEVSRATIGDLRPLGDKVAIYVEGKGKDEKEPIRINPVIEKAIREYLTLRGRTKDTAPLFASMSNKNEGEAMTTRSISGIVKNRLRAVGIDSGRLTAHSLRHTAITLAIRNGQSIEDARQFARHSNIATTMVYFHEASVENNRCSDTIIESIFGGEKK